MISRIGRGPGAGAGFDPVAAMVVVGCGGTGGACGGAGLGITLLLVIVREIGPNREPHPPPILIRLHRNTDQR